MPAETNTVSFLTISMPDVSDHVNRTLQELRRLNLHKEGRTIKVVDRERLAGLASFDGNYLNMPQLLSRWDVKIEGTSTPAERSPAICHPPTSATRLCSKSEAQGSIGSFEVQCVSLLARATPRPPP